MQYLLNIVNDFSKRNKDFLHLIVRVRFTIRATVWYGFGLVLKTNLTSPVNCRYYNAYFNK